MKEKDWFMMFPEDYNWSVAAIIAISSSSWGGGEIGEIYKVCASLKGRVGDNSAWFSEWNKMGERIASLAEKAESEGHFQTASAAFLRASHYIQLGERYLQPRTPESQKAYARSVTFFKKGLPHVPFLSIEPVEVPFEGGKSLPAYFIKREGSTEVKWPTVVFFDGLDVTKEMIFVYAGTPELAKRGMACLLIDGPGNGESIRFRGIPLRHDYEVAGSAAVDYLESRGDVDESRLGVMGISLGGYYASRCAAFERRFKASVAWGGIYDYHAIWKRRIEVECRDTNSMPAEHLFWILGVKNVEEALTKLEKFTLKGVANKIKCSFLITHGEEDAQIPMDDARKLFEEASSSNKTLRVFTREEGGAQHVMMDNRTIAIAYIGDWLADRLVRQ
jgi:dipeptidyl aminopeptidase/acylaminoacyl peptidase